ncbi:MAG TPA: hypothetical protein VGB99_18030 [Acidobacteriota bacterium]
MSRQLSWILAAGLALGLAVGLPTRLGAAATSYRAELQNVMADFERGEALRLEGRSGDGRKISDAAAKRLNVAAFGIFSSYTLVWSGLLLGSESPESLRSVFDEILLVGVVAQKAVDYLRALGNERYATVAQYLYDYWINTYQTDLQQKKQLLASAPLAKDKEKIIEMVDQQLDVFSTVKSLPPEDLEMMRYQLLEQLKGG